MHRMRGFIVFVVLLIISLPLQAQFIEVQVDIAVDRMPEKERVDLKSLAGLIKSYYENYDWTDNSYGMQIPLRINIYPQSVNTTGSERIFTAQLFITNESGDQRFFEKSFRFVYNTNDPLVHQELFHPLTSTLDFYAWMLLAGETDTYEPLGGNNLYEKARDVATKALMSEKPQGWKERQQTLDEILRLRNYRLFKYYFWQAMDLSDQGKTSEVPLAIDRALHHLEAQFTENARERYTHVFLDAHARDLMTVIKALGNPSQQQKLMALDPDNTAVYQKILKDQGD